MAHRKVKNNERLGGLHWTESAQAERYVQLVTAISQVAVVRHALLRYPTGLLSSSQPTSEPVRYKLRQGYDLTVLPGYDPRDEVCDFTVSRRRGEDDTYLIVRDRQPVLGSIVRQEGTESGIEAGVHFATPQDMLDQDQDMFPEEFIRRADAAYKYATDKLLPVAVMLDWL